MARGDRNEEVQDLFYLGRFLLDRTKAGDAAPSRLAEAEVLFRRCLDGPVSGVSARTSPGAMALNVPFEWGKLLYQLTVERRC